MRNEPLRHVHDVGWRTVVSRKNISLKLEFLPAIKDVLPWVENVFRCSPSPFEDRLVIIPNKCQGGLMPFSQSGYEEQVDRIDVLKLVNHDVRVASCAGYLRRLLRQFPSPVLLVLQCKLILKR